MADSDIVIRDAVTEDAPAIAALLGELGYPTDQAQVVARLARMLAEGRAAVFVAQGEKLHGVITAHAITSIHHDKAVAWITSLVVTHDSRRQGVGRRLVEAAEVWARSRDCGRIAVTSAMRREDAHAFYQQLGYEHSGHRFSRTLDATT